MDFAIGILIALVVVVIYISRAYINKTSPRRLEFIIRTKFLSDGGGIKEVSNVTPGSISVRRVKTQKHGNKVNATISYSTPTIPPTTADLLYTIRPVCSMFDPLCLTY